jgi:predicted ArsR family transcriptional regulator
MSQSAEQKILYFLKSRGRQATIDVAARLEITVAGARKHLHKLRTDGLIEHEDRRLSVGRPKRYWSLTHLGHGRFPDAHSDLTLELIRTAREVFGQVGLESLIAARQAHTLHAYSEALSDKESLPHRVKALADLRTREGYMAEVLKLDGNALLLAENHCPICAAATECQGLCRSELEIFRQALGDNIQVTRVDHLLAGARRCAYRIEPADG